MCEMVLTSLFCLQGVRANRHHIYSSGGIQVVISGGVGRLCIYYCNVLELGMRLCL